MQEAWSFYLTQLGGVFFALLGGYLALLLTWPAFLLLEKSMPVLRDVPRSNYWLNWRITWSNLLLAPAFAALVVVGTLSVASISGLPSLEVPTPSFSVGIPLLDILLQGTAIFFIACFLGDFSYYWWHRAQHTFPVLWELHKLHHSDEHLNTTTIFRSHFLEPAGQSLFRGLTLGLVFNVTDTSPNAMALIAGALMLGLWDFFIHANVRIPVLHKLLPFFSTPQYHWIHHSKLPQHQDKNFAIWLPLYDVAFGSYYHPEVDEYPPTGLQSGEQFHSVWQAQTAPFVSWALGLKKFVSGGDSKNDVSAAD
ncbi:MAG: sterol desaturase/sphingolipid hydroxylase (fatty acid hydroxylase superfamily) [Bacteroidia bacterium]|jgi:sterol desaturase/sphingolipid hydroxylase (fatty acid hydroxylase superfamily)